MRQTIFGALDGFLLLLLISPVSYLVMFRPMQLKIAALREAREEVRRKNRELALLVDRNEMILTAAEEGILGLDREGKTIFTNPTAERILGWTQEELIGKDHHGLIHHSFCDEHASGGMCPLRQCLSTGLIFHHVEENLRRKDGGAFPVELSCAPMKDGEEITGAVLTFRDITERKKTEQKLKELAYFDALTGLPNRPLLQDRFSRLAAQARREEKIPAIMFIDLDDFKKINDRHGHAAGDFYLREIARRIREIIRKTDTIARLGGDEFVWTGLVRKTHEAALVANRILDSLSSPIMTDGKRLQASASIGIAFHPRDGENFEELLKAADDAMYRAKERGKRGFFLAERSPDNGQATPGIEAPEEPQFS